MRLIDCDARHLDAIRAIFNHAIAHSTALYEYQPRSAETIRAWWDAKQSQGWPVLGVCGEADELLGFASYGTFRAWPAYGYTVEHSLYVAEAHRRRGVGRHLLTALIERARAAEMHVMIGGIDADNAASIALHESMGFTAGGRLPEVGFKFGRWLDLCFYQLVLDTPSQPREG